MSIDYKKELENTARNMIMVHEPDTLIKMVARMLVAKIRVSHASILLADGDSYRLTVSRGSLAAKIPVGLARIDKENPLILFFKERKDELLFNDRAVVYERTKKVFRKRKMKRDLRQLVEDVLYQMQIFDVEVCVPCYFRDELLGILLLGKKKLGRSFSQEELDFFIALASSLAMAIRNARLFKELESELDKERQLFMRTTIALAAAIEAKDHYTHGHTTRVTNISLAIAKKISQKNKKVFEHEFLEELRVASLLHDIGKIGIPEYILNKEDPLTEEERKRIKEHPLIGVAILKPIRELNESMVGVKYHHERPDGKGYPEGLKDNEIPLIASIISVADSFDAMITDRPYRRRLLKSDAMKEIQELAGKQFNPQVTRALVELYQEGKI